MVSRENIIAAVNKMILSASGWRGIFSSDEESPLEQISEAHRIICGTAGLIFAEYLRSRERSADNGLDVCTPIILIGTDTRPTGKAITDAIIPVLLAENCDVRYAGITAAPEIMAWARSLGSDKTAGFIYISASHNPIGHNGIKFGLTDGGVLAAETAEKLIANFRGFLDSNDSITKIESLISAADSALLQKVHNAIPAAKTQALKAYYGFCGQVVYGGSSAISAALKAGLEERPLGIVCDFNGCARTVSIDRDFFSALNVNFDCINDKPGQIVHRIVPEGESMEPCGKLLEKAHERDTSFVMGYVPDCDGDRGNLVIFDETVGRARPLEAQEVFALACVAEFSHLVWTGELSYNADGSVLSKAAIAINDPTSLRIDRIATAFGVSVFRAEVGEANVVSLARKLRGEGYIVRILGEGSAGGNITHPSAVRDPLSTVLALAKMLSVRSVNRKSASEKPGLFKIWLERSGQIEKNRDDFTLADIIASLPQFSTSPAYSKDAILCINTKDHAILKDRYQEIFLRDWKERKDELKERYGFCKWEAIAYNGLKETRNLSRFGSAGKGGLKLLFFDSEGREAAYIWMRGSATEPVFRIMADAESPDIERRLLEWQRQMVIESDNRSCSETSVSEQKE
ncbi:MAG: phosphatidylglycerol lysyltransferase [Treponema sp.]|jgi:phosphoglucomutase|nr:phosphatidylglycerol lysyltransferase [Treponema sp.]